MLIYVIMGGFSVVVCDHYIHPVSQSVPVQASNGERVVETEEG